MWLLKMLLKKQLIRINSIFYFIRQQNLFGKLFTKLFNIMYLKSTLTNMKHMFSVRSLAVIMFALFTGLANAQTYTNGNLSTGANLAGGGAAAPAGTTWSQLQGTNSGLGFGANITAGITLADNFVVPAGPNWGLTKVSFFAYSTNFAGAVSPFNDVRVLIYNADPSIGNPTPIFGDFTTNRFASSTFSNIYRTAATASLVRGIWRVEANVSTSLAPGTYWIEWQLGNGGISNFTPPSTVAGVPTPPGGNSKQRTIAGNTWVNIVDAGGGGAQDQYFIIDYTTGPCAGTPTPGNTIASAPAVCPTNPVTLSVQNPPGGSGITYIWQSGPSATGPWTTIAGATNSTYSTNMLAATTFFQAIVACSGSPATSTPVQVILNPPSACYCVPGNTDCTDGDILTNVTLGALNNTSACGTNGYTNYTANSAITVPNIIQGAGNPITITAGTGSFTQSVAVWIDYNKSGSFEASEFTFIGTAATPIVRNGVINVPANAPLGQTRMRVRTRFATALAAGNACLTYTYGETEDYTVNIVPCVPVVLTTSPANRSVACGGSTTFTAAAAGSLPTYYWQFRVTATSPWLNVPNAAPYTGVNTATLSIATISDMLNGYQYRAVFQGACTGADFTSAATLTVTPLVATVTNTLPIEKCITDAPVRIGITNLSGGTATATTASGALNLNIPDNNDETLLQNTNAINHTINVTNVPAGVSVNGFRVRLNMAHSWVGDMVIVLRAPDGRIINLDYALSGTGGAGPTTGFTNTIISSAGTAALSSGANPYSATFRLDNAGASTAGFTPTGPAGFNPTTNVISQVFQGNGAWTIAMYDYYRDLSLTNVFQNWEISIDYGAPANGVFSPAAGLFTDAAGTIPYVANTPINTVFANPATTTNYSLVVTTANCTSSALTIPVNVRALPTSISAVANRAICVARNTSFTAMVVGGAPSGLQWQVSTDAGATFANVTNGGVYSGATTSTLSLANVPASFNGFRYRLTAAAAPCPGVVNSTTGTLTVNSTPIVVLSVSPLTELYPGQTTTLTAAVTPNPGATFTWFRNGVPVAGATGNTLVIDIDGLGVYTASVTDVNGCFGTSSASVEIKDAANDILFIYPSPNSGQFQVRFFSGAGNNPLPRIISIYDNKGSRIYTRTYTIAVPYTRMDVDLKNHGKGIYNVELSDGNGRRLKTGRVVIH